MRNVASRIWIATALSFSLLACAVSDADPERYPETGSIGSVPRSGVGTTRGSSEVSTGEAAERARSGVSGAGIAPDEAQVPAGDLRRSGAAANDGDSQIWRITIDTSTRHQTLDGFGAALPMWENDPNDMLTTDEVRTLVGLGDDELGLSIIRTIIDPETERWPYAVENLREAKAYGSNVQVLATPWSPPANMKSNGSTLNGGKLLVDSYGDYAAHLDAYVQYMAAQNVTIDVVSVQNEPDWNPSYDSCEWTGQELRNFVRDHGDAIGAKLLVGESTRFDRAYTDPALNDPTAAANLDLIGGHLYYAEEAGFFARYPLAEQAGKGRWMTEWLTHEADGDGSAIWGSDDQAVWDETLDDVLGTVHKAMVVDWNAYIWWWARRFYSLIGDGEAQYGTQAGQILKRGWAFSHYAKYIRPGYTRVGTTDDGSFASLSVTAFEGERHIVSVLLNRSTESYTDVVFEIPGVTAASAEAYVTSRTANRAAVEITAQGSYATLSTLAPRSVTTVIISY